jgi:hypothetical protein
LLMLLGSEALGSANVPFQRQNPLLRCPLEAVERVLLQWKQL